MKSIFIVCVIIFVLTVHVNCKSDLSGFEFLEPTDYNTACGEPFNDEFPWLVKIYLTERSEPRFICNGNIIDKNTIITNAHCVSLPGGLKVHHSKLLIEVGKLKFMDRNEIATNYTCRAVIRHHNYDRETYANDIAILKMTKPIVFTSYVHPICLTDDITKFNTTQLGVVPTWTYLNKKSTEDVLSSVYLPIVYDNDNCVTNSSLDPVFLNENNFCVGKMNQSYGLCQGSAGASLTLIEERQTKYVWYIKGLLSIGEAKFDGSDMACTGVYVFTDVFKYYNWINEIR